VLSREGRTALHYAALVDSPSIAQFLLQLGAEVDARDASSKTALHHANALSTARVLVSSGASLGVYDDCGFVSEHVFMDSEADMAALRIAALAFDDNRGHHSQLDCGNGLNRNCHICGITLQTSDSVIPTLLPQCSDVCCEACFNRMQGRPSALLWGREEKNIQEAA
jgi:hypothetical protein